VAPPRFRGMLREPGVSGRAPWIPPMPRTSLAATLAVLAVLPISAAAAPQKTVSVDLVAEIGDVPEGGDGTAITALNYPTIGADGSVGFTGSLASQDVFVWRGEGILWLNSDAPKGTVLTGGESTMGLSSTGGFIYSPAANGEDAVWTQAGLLLRETDPIPGTISTFSTFNSRPSMTAAGLAFWVSGLGTMPTGPTYGRAFMRCDDPSQPANATILLASDQVVSDGTTDYLLGPVGIGFAYSVSEGAKHINLIVKVDGVPTSTDDFLWVDGELLEREGNPIVPGSLEKWGAFRGVGINDDANRCFFGPLVGGSADSNEYLAYNGVIIVREGETLDGVDLPPGSAIRWAAINDGEQIVHVWEGAGSPPANGAMFVTLIEEGQPQSRALLRIGDLLDLDGDAQGDATLVDFNAGATIGPGFGLSDEPWTFLSVKFAAGGLVREGIIRVSLPGEDSPADLNGDGVVNGADLAILLGAWGGRGIADINGDGIVNGADLSILLGAWSA